ncbi:GDSL-type esterase/lipase family protein [Actinoplanes couchii]|uniref:SGNH hydrolase n=1 Tax=Actinoplanes couchii TaxID=403638 RepID=A0ABQ3XK73_9ACTN|nr:GDSL-type esterase/lipase family protein [Actinoplanes couchii]MDR6320491.1 lysophospholipase L1-like esterase [Actinoplanes couchii]GID58895.1 SGNH hydrolase [Actinoplanes couchii]
MEAAGPETAPEVLIDTVLPAATGAPAAAVDDVGIRSRVAVWGPAVEVAPAATGTFDDVTIRHVVYASGGGTRPRVRVSNLHGTTPLAVGHVDLAEQSLGGVAVPGSHHRLTFGGLGSVTVPAGTELFSDPADMTITAGSNLLISIYLPEDTGPATAHRAGLTRTYVSTAGDHAADDGSENYPHLKYQASWYFLSGLDLLSPVATGTVVAFGDSITDGYGSTALTNRRYPDYLARRIAAARGGANRTVVNAGMANNRVLRDVGDGAAGGRSALSRFGHDALGFENVRAVILLEGVNDIMDDVTAAQLQEGYRQLVATAHERGVPVYGATILPFGGSKAYNARREAVRQQVNTGIRAGNVFDGYFDFDAKVCDPADRTRLRADYALDDKLHLTDAGMSALADAVDLRVIGAGVVWQLPAAPCWAA